MKLITILRNYFMGTANIERLKAKGLKIGKDCFIGSGTFIDPLTCPPILVPVPELVEI